MPKDRSKPRGRMSAYGFFTKYCREQYKERNPEGGIVFSEFSKECARVWKTLSGEHRQKFQLRADEDKVRYEIEMSQYDPPAVAVNKKGSPVKEKKKKVKKDPNAPKRPLSGFFWFCNDERPKVRGLNPELTIGSIAKELGRLWKQLEPATKAKYEAMAARDKVRYEREMTAYKRFLNAPVPLDINQGVYDDEDEMEEEDE